jgi:hypothetical protein
MILLKDIPFEFKTMTFEEYLETCLSSNSGCKIRVKDKENFKHKYYSAHTNSKGEVVLEEFKPEFELTEEELKNLIK